MFAAANSLTTAEMLPVKADLRGDSMMERGSYPPAEYPEVTLDDLGRMLGRHRLLIFLSIVVAVALGVAYTLYARPMYEATSVVRFEAPAMDLPQLVQLPYSNNLISTEIEVAEGSKCSQSGCGFAWAARLAPCSETRQAQPVLCEPVGLADGGYRDVCCCNSGPMAHSTSRAKAAAKSIGVARVGDTTRIAGMVFVLSQRRDTSARLGIRVSLTLGAAIQSFQSALDVSRPQRDADLIAIRTRAADPAQAAAMANAVANNLIAGGRKQAAVAPRPRWCSSSSRTTLFDGSSVTPKTGSGRTRKGSTWSTFPSRNAHRLREWRSSRPISRAYEHSETRSQRLWMK